MSLIINHVAVIFAVSMLSFSRFSGMAPKLILSNTIRISTVAYNITRIHLLLKNVRFKITPHRITFLGEELGVLKENEFAPFLF